MASGLHILTEECTWDEDHPQDEEEQAVICIGTFPRIVDRIPSTTPDAETPRDARDSGSARSHNRSLLPSGGLMADVPCLDHSLDGCKGYPDDVRTTKHARRTHAWSRCTQTSLGAHVSPFGASSVNPNRDSPNGYPTVTPTEL